MSHFGQNCRGLFLKTHMLLVPFLLIFNAVVLPVASDEFRSSFDANTGLVKLFIPDSGSSGGAGSGGEEVLVCKKLWNTAAANVACKEHGQPL